MPILPIIIAIFAILLRTTFHWLPNVELVTATMLLASLYSRRTAFILTFIVLAVTDVILGNTSIFLFTWSGFLIPALIISSLKIKNLKLKIPSATLLGIAANLFFYVWTNLGVWVLDSWGMYPKTALGLVSCYINGLPFLKNQLESTLLFVPLVFILHQIFAKLYTWPTTTSPQLHSVSQISYTPLEQTKGNYDWGSPTSAHT
jgi:hypothetical protein